jgi:hypothetical protein
MLDRHNERRAISGTASAACLRFLTVAPAPATGGTRLAGSDATAARARGISLSPSLRPDFTWLSGWPATRYGDPDGEQDRRDAWGGGGPASPLGLRCTCSLKIVIIPPRFAALHGEPGHLKQGLRKVL